MGIFKNLFKKRGVVEYERPISFFLNDKKEMFFKGIDFYKFLLEYRTEFDKRGLTSKNNDAAQLLEMFITNFEIFSDNEKFNKNTDSN